MNNNENMVATNPRFFIEAASHNWITIKAPFFHVSLYLDIIPYRFVPLDYQATWSLENKNRYC